MSYSTPAVTTVTQAVELPSSTILVTDTSQFPSGGGWIYVQDSGGGTWLVQYSATTGTSFTGCLYGANTLSAGSLVASAASTTIGGLPIAIPLAPPATTVSSNAGGATLGQTTTVDPSSVGTSLPTSTINVASTTNFPSSGWFTIPVMIGSSSTTAWISYTNKTSTSFTGCAGGPPTSTITSGTIISALSVPSTLGFPDIGTLSVVAGGALVNVAYTGTTSNAFILTASSSGSLVAGSPVLLDTGYATVTTSSTALPGAGGAGVTLAVSNAPTTSSLTAGTILVQMSSGPPQAFSYTGTTSTSFTGVVGLSSGGTVPANATVIMNSLPLSSAANFPTGPSTYNVLTSNGAGFQPVYSGTGALTVGSVSYLGNCSGGTGAVSGNYPVVLDLLTFGANPASMVGAFDSEVSLNQSAPTIVNNYAALRSIPAPSSVGFAQVLGAKTPGDGGGGLFFWDSNTPPNGALDDNLGIVLQSFTTSFGRWRREGFRLITTQVSSVTQTMDTGPNRIELKWFGVLADGASDDSYQVSQALTAASLLGAASSGGGVLGMPAATCLIANTVSVPSNVTLDFSGGGQINVNGSAFLTIGGSVVAPGQQIFLSSSTNAAPILFVGGQDVINALWFGADASGSKGSDAALQLAFYSVHQVTEIYPESTEVFLSPTLLIPAGEYLIETGGLEIQQGKIQGNGAVLLATTSGSSSTIDFFQIANTGGFWEIDGVTFVHGRNALVVSAGSSLPSQDIVIRNCKFVSNAGAWATTDVTCANTDVLISNCYAENSDQLTGTVVNMTCANQVVINQCSGEVFGTTVFQLAGSGGVGKVHITDCDWAPGTAGGQWILVEAGWQVSCECTRFGGEAGNKPVVHWNAPVGAGGMNVGTGLYPDNLIEYWSFTCVDCEIASTQSADTFLFYTLPLRMRINGNKGGSGAYGIYFDPGIPRDEINQIGRLFTISPDTELASGPQLNIASGSSSEVLDRYLAPGLGAFGDLPPSGAIQLAIPASSYRLIGAPLGSSGQNITSSTGYYGEAGLSLAATSSSNLSWTCYNLAGVLTGSYATGPFTLYVNIGACTNTTQLEVRVLGGSRTLSVTSAQPSVLAIPFYKGYADPSPWSSTAVYSTLGQLVLGSDSYSVWQSTTVGTTTGTSAPNVSSIALGYPGLTFNDGAVVWEWVGDLLIDLCLPLPTVGASITYERLRVVAGHANVQTRNSIVTGTGAPASGAWFLGDICQNAGPASGGPMGWVCTVPGTAGSAVFNTYGSIGPHPTSQGSTPSVGSFNSNWGSTSNVSVTGGDSSMLITFETGSGSAISAQSALFTVTLSAGYQIGGVGSISYTASPTYAGTGAAGSRAGGGSPGASSFYAVETATNTFTVYNTTGFTPASSTYYNFQVTTAGAPAV